MVELHSNFTFEGTKTTMDGVLPTNHAEHETVEITQGITDWFETGFYIFTSIQSDGGWQWVGDHIRPRVSIPESWHWPVGVSLSNEIGYQRAAFSRRHLDLGNPSNYRQENRSLVSGLQPRARPVVSWPQRAPGFCVLSQFQIQLRLHKTNRRRAGVLRFLRTDHGFQSAPRSATAVRSCH